MNDPEDVHVLTFVFVDTFHLDIEERVGIDGDAVGFFDMEG